MFADTITFTINSVAKVLTRINQDKYSSEYYLRETLGEFRASIRHSSYVDKTRGGRKVDRHNVELRQEVYAVAPQTSSTVRKAYAVFENDSVDTIVDPVNLDLGFAGFLTNANVTKMVNWES
jgi:hypothetical protein